MKTIGVYGHRGAGKKTIAAMLGIVLDNLFAANDEVKSDIRQKTEDWKVECLDFAKAIVYNENNLDEYLNYSYNHIQFAAFKDAPLALIQMLTGIPFETLNSDYAKDHTYINIDTLEWGETQDPHTVSCTASEAYTILKDSPIGKYRKAISMTLREYIIYFGYEIMQRLLGANVWVNSTRVNSHDEYTGNTRGFQIFTDVKTAAEISYIRDLEGITIQVDNPNHNKGESFNGHVNNKPNYTITIKECSPEGLAETMFNQVTDIAIELYDKYYGRTK